MESPWLTVFDHRFIDSNILNCRHIDGNLDFSTPSPQIIRETLSDGTMFHYGHFDGLPNWLLFAPGKHLGGIIGTEVSARIRLQYPLQNQHIATFFWGATDHYMVDPSHSFFWGEWGMVMRPGQLDVIYRGVNTTWQSFPNTPDIWFDILWIWRITGQSILFFNGEVVAACPGVGSGLTHGLFTIGVGFRPPTPIPFPLDIAHVRVSVLTQERVERTLDSSIPITPIDYERLKRCRQEIVPAIQALTHLFRDLMAVIVSQETRIWEQGDEGSPITWKCAKLHKIAQQAASLMVQYLEGNDQALKDFRSRLDEFLKLLASLAGNQIPELKEQVDLILREIHISQECKEVAKGVRNTYSERFERLESLLEVVIDTIRESLGVDWNG